MAGSYGTGAELKLVDEIRALLLSVTSCRPWCTEDGCRNAPSFSEYFYKKINGKYYKYVFVYDA